MSDGRGRFSFFNSLPGYITIFCGAVAGLWTLTEIARRKEREDDKREKERA